MHTYTSTIVVLLSITSIVGATSACDGSFAELAVNSLGSPFESVLSGCKNFTVDLKPESTFVHDYRKSLLLLKNLLDTFSGAYFPINSADALGNLVDITDAGYEIIGDYQDLAHTGVPYTKSDVAKRMAACQGWRSQMLGNMSAFDFHAYLMHPQEGVTYDKRAPSKFFWSHNAFQANAALSGQGNLVLLLSEMIDKMALRYDEVMAYDTIIPDENHENFHNVRKSSRAINFLTENFPCIVVDTAATSAALALFGELYDKWGDLNDEWTAYDYYVQHGNKTAAAAEMKVVEAGWVSLKAWASSQQLRVKALLDLRSLVASGVPFLSGLPAACSEQIAVGSKCSVQSSILRPTQFDVGLAEVMGNKVGFFVNQSLNDIVEYLNRKPIPVVLGPQGRMYQVDGHHTTYAMAWWKRHVLGPMAPSPLRDTLLSLPLVASVMCNWTSAFATEEAFWDGMKAKKWVLLESQGSPRTPAQLPRTVSLMGDNPYRSLAGIAEVVSVPAIGKGCIPFAEFRWAEYYIEAYNAGKMSLFYKMMLEGAQAANYSAFEAYISSTEFLNVTHSSEATGLPGYLPPGGTAPPIPDCPWNATCARP